MSLQISVLGQELATFWLKRSSTLRCDQSTQGTIILCSHQKQKNLSKIDCLLNVLTRTEKLPKITHKTSLAALEMTQSITVSSLNQFILINIVRQLQRSKKEKSAKKILKVLSAQICRPLLEYLSSSNKTNLRESLCQKFLSLKSISADFCTNCSQKLNNPTKRECFSIVEEKSKVL